MNTRRLVPLLVAAALLAACGKSAAPAAAPTAVAPPPTPELATLYNSSCRSCHSVPASGAPQTGDAKAWAPRVAQGRDVLLAHVVNGYQKMPPMGMCMQCTEEQFAALTEYMAGRSLQ